LRAECVQPEENVMRFVVPALGLGALALVGFMATSEPASAAKSKMGCEIGKQTWDASAGQCVAAKGKAKKAKKARKTAARAKGKKK
jgi:hypothetical protein